MSRIGSARYAAIACFVLASSAALAQSPSLDSRRESALSPGQQATLARHDELQAAIVKQDAARVSAMIRGGMPLDFNFDETARGRTSQSPLTVAISLNHLAIARLLLEGGATAGRLDGFGEAAVHSVKSLEAVQLLEKHGADIDAQNRRGMTALAQAVERGDLAKVELLIAGGARLDAPLKGPDLFTVAVKGNHAELIPVLLARGADPRSPPTAALWPLIESGDTERARMLVERGADPDARNDREWLITRALYRQRWEVVASLADAGANLRLPDGPECASAARGCYSIELARTASLHPPTLARLKSRGLDLDAYAAGGHTALTALIVDPMYGATGSVRGGTAASATIPASDVAARARALLGQGADPNRRYRDLTPLMLAIAIPGPRALSDLLVDAGGRVEYRSTIQKQGWNELPTPGYPLPAGASTVLRSVSEPLIHNNLRLFTGMTVGPLTWTTFHRRPDAAVRLLARDRKVAPEDRFLLYFAGLLGAWDVVIQALAHTREVNVSDRAGVTPLMLAAEDGQVDAVKALIAGGAKLDAKSANDWPPLLETPPAMLFMGHGPTRPRLVGGYTALKAARGRQQEEVVRVLLAAGARD
ncbi:MAG: ankyrin repeat domain-containing protein [Betaproteobacteria bacterium]|nr:ankyrin repeat domain-containing protein [Betaproteobacteria bacterium]